MLIPVKQLTSMSHDGELATCDIPSDVSLSLTPTIVLPQQDEPPVDFLVKNLLSSDKEFFIATILHDFQFTSLGDFVVGGQPQDTEKLNLAFLQFYRSHRTLRKFLRWSIERDIQRQILFRLPHRNSPPFDVLLSVRVKPF